jgi:PAS domain S-box-containing protein
MPTILRYGIAVLSLAIAIGLDFFLLRQFDAILTPFLFAVAATVWFTGTGPSMLAIVLSVLSLNYFFLRPGFSFSPISYADLVYLSFCIFCAWAVGWVSAVRRQTEQELRQARDEFEAKVTPPEWHERDRRALGELSSNTMAQPYEKEFFRKDGTRVPVLIGGALFEEGGDEGVAFVLDLTERKRAERALMRSEAYLAQALKLTRTGSWVWDPRTEKVLFCSEEMFRIFGLDPRESLPSRDNFRQQIHPEDRDWVKKKFEESLRERVDTFAEYRVLLPDGTVRHINASGHLVLNEDGELIEFVGTATDVTERKRPKRLCGKAKLKSGGWSIPISSEFLCGILMAASLRPTPNSFAW